MADINRRKNTRVFFQAIADLHFDNKCYNKCETRNLSVSSIFIVGVDDQKEGSQCEIALHLSGATSDLLLKMKGEIVRCEAEGIALRFFETDLDSYYHLKNIVYYNAENPDEFNEEFPGYIPHPSID